MRRDLDQPTVFLACAADDAASMSGVARELARQGVGSTVVGGVDLDARPIEQALPRTRGSFLWVLCGSAELDRYQLDVLKRALAEASVPPERVLEVVFDPRAPFGFVGAVKRRLRALGASPKTLTSTPPPVPSGPVRRASPPKRLDTGPLLVPDRSEEIPVSGSTMVAPRPGRWARVAVRGVASLGVFAVAWVAIGAMMGEDEPASAEEDASSAEVVSAPPPAVEAEAEPVVAELPEPEEDVEQPSRVASRDVISPAREGEREPSDRQTLLEVSFAERRVRGLDLLLITYPSRKALTRASAERACAASEEGGLDTWRLPTPLELAQLGRAGFVSKYTMWWTGSDGSAARSLWTGVRTLAKRGAARSRAKVLCVTERPR
jgi:hypothetical protein